MSRRATAKPLGIQMFPFLAVLICTMGALVVLLHAFARHGQAQARQIAQAEAKARQFNVEDFQWRIDHLRTAREKTAAELTDERLKLAHVEDHQRRLQEKLRRLKLAVAEMESATAAKIEEKYSTADELAAAKAELAEARAAVDAAQRQGKQKRVNYSIVPYDGRNTTHRRPIYIECRENVIVLQPEGVELSPRDFGGAFSPGNPLAVALRAQREYFASQTPDGKLAKEPYPLLLVRPEGVVAYYAARAALDSWGSDFGYELIGSDWLLKFPDPDPQLEALTRKVVSESRRRHREYVTSSPYPARRRSRPVYRARAHGGFAPVDGSGGGLGNGGRGGWDGFGGDWARGGNGAGDSRYGSSRGRGEFAGDGNGAGDSWHGSNGGPSEGGNSTLEDPYGDPGSGLAGGGPGGEGPLAGSPGDAAGLTADHGEPGGTEIGGNPSAQKGGDSQATELGGPGLIAGNPNRRGDAGSGSYGSASAAGKADGQSPATGEQPPFSSPPAGGTSSSQGSHSCPNPSSSSATASLHKPRSIASIRGENWGLPGASRGAVAATRPIPIVAHPDRLVILPESRGQQPVEIPLAAQTRDSIDELVSGVWEHMHVWGKAGRGLYWRPILSIDVKPGAANRYTDLEALLAGSGLDVEQRQPAARRQGVRPPTRRSARPLFRQ